jgi:hypothetical protein
MSIPPNNPTTSFPVLKDTVYFHFAKPLGTLNPFQSLIQRVQNAMGFTKWETTHVFVSCNNQIIDRTGVFTLTTDQDAHEYLIKNYNGYEVNSYGTSDKNVLANFSSYFKFISTVATKPVYTEDPITGEYYAATTIQYQPNNTVYGIGKETAVTLKESFQLLMSGTKISETDAIRKATDVVIAAKFLPSTQLKNPTYCSLTIGGLITPLYGQSILRYPALSHAFLSKSYIDLGMSYLQTIIKL